MGRRNGTGQDQGCRREQGGVGGGTTPPLLPWAEPPAQPRLLLKERRRGVGGESEAKTKFVYLKSASNFRPFDKYPFLPEENCSDVGVGGLGRPGLARVPNTPPPRP